MTGLPCCCGMQGAGFFFLCGAAFPNLLVESMDHLVTATRSCDTKRSTTCPRCFETTVSPLPHRVRLSVTSVIWAVGRPLWRMAVSGTNMFQVHFLDGGALRATAAVSARVGTVSRLVDNSIHRTFASRASWTLAVTSHRGIILAPSLHLDLWLVPGPWPCRGFRGNDVASTQGAGRVRVVSRFLELDSLQLIEARYEFCSLVERLWSFFEAAKDLFALASSGS